MEAHGHFTQARTHMASAASRAPDASSAVVCWSAWTFDVLGCSRQHRLSAFDPEAAIGKGGARLREIIER